MELPCKIKALKYVTYGANLEMSSGQYADVTLEQEKNNNKYRTLKVTHGDTEVLFSELALLNAIKRGDFEVA